LHKKSFTFGIGVGVLVVTSIFYLFSRFSTPPVVLQEVLVELTNDQILERAIELGYVNVTLEDGEEDILPVETPSIEIQEISENNEDLESYGDSDVEYSYENDVSSLEEN